MTGRILQAVLAFSATIGGASGQPTPGSNTATAKAAERSAGKEAMAARRKTLAHRGRRIILNNDGGDCATPLPAGDVSARDVFLKQRTSPLVGSQVDSIFYCTGWAFGTVLHRTEVAENFTIRAGAEHRNRVLRHFLDQGTDSLHTMVDFCHEHGIEIFWSMRMNDTHDAKNPLLRAQMKRDHPEYLLGSAGNRPRFGQWTAVDFEHPAVRDLAFRYIEEVCANYDVDGIELDFFRHPVFFKSHAFGGTAGQRERDLLTGLLRRIREMADARGQARGRPILIAIRVPDSVPYCEQIGIDLQNWLRLGLTDLLITGGYFRLNPWEYSVALGRRYGIPVYPSLDSPVGVVDPNIPDREFSLEDRLPWVKATKECPMDAKRKSLKSWRGRAMRAFQAGADGVYLFNMFTPTHQMLWQIGDPEGLRDKSKLYVANWRGTRQPPSNYMARGNTFYHERPLNPMFPLEIGNAALTVRLPIGERPEAAAAKGLEPTVTAELWIQPAAVHDAMSVTCNGQVLGDGLSSDERLVFSLPPALIRSGPNTFVLRRREDVAVPKTFLRDITVEIGYPETD